MQGYGVLLHLLAAAGDDGGAALLVHLEHEGPGLRLGVAEVGLEHVTDVAHEVHGIIPDHDDPGLVEVGLLGRPHLLLGVGAGCKAYCHTVHSRSHRRCPVAWYSYGGRPAIVLRVTDALTTESPDAGSAPPAVDAPNSALFTDQYELTMLQASLHSGAAHRRSVFEAFARRLPAGRRYGVVAGTGRLLEALASFRFDEAQLTFLSDHRIVDDTTLEWLAGFRFTGSISGYAEGEAYFPNSPILTVESSFAEACILETLILSVLNHDSAIASAASRMTGAAAGRPCIEMGSRRTHEEAAVAAARAAIIGGFASTSNLEAGRRYGLPTVGTAAHSFTLLHDSERAAFEAQVASLGRGTSLLVDTYDVEQGVRTAVEVAGADLGAVRLDSGDLVAQARWVRQLLDDLGNHTTRIVVTSDLDEFAIGLLASAPVDSYGVGTSLVTGSGAPTAGMVYKLVSRQDDDGTFISVAKAAKNKASVGGIKHALRRLDEHGTAQVEVVGVGISPADDGNDRPLMQQFVKEGVLLPGWTGPEAVTRAAERHALSMAELPGAVRRLQRGEPVIPTEYEEAS
ncbi:nicotinate phosphoribosyltransferase [Arthrobacter cheniae]|uniref:Nicotinate phosphoribosyltransferase n=1 Tax=Arthrobacter cheniae TaxID=1258888 RepID=A0A3A5M7E6_9MICC|nr:nicotinate phosphoribosyltransferase [Arthrobacter cheniae]